MLRYNYAEFVNALALYARTRLSALDRGTLLIRISEDGSLLAGVFGNDGYLRDAKSRIEADLVRHRLKDLAAAELGFGLSPDGHTWAVLVKADRQRCQTVAARVFQMEMLRSTLDDVLVTAWQAAERQPAGAAPYSQT
jgi:hypothetical protein